MNFCAVQRNLAQFSEMGSQLLLELPISQEPPGSFKVKDTRILQRAYISANMAGIANTTDGPLIGHVIFKNVGRLPARKFCWLVKISVGDEGFTPPKIKRRELEGIRCRNGPRSEQGVKVAVPR